MSEYAIQLDGVNKRFKKAQVLYDIDLTLKKGHICGLIGPNGAGKSTIMKIISGLIYRTSGEIRFFGSGELDKQRRRMSFMIENPYIDPQMTAYDNLAYLRYVKGYPDEKRIDKVLDIIGLSDTGNKIVQKFSLGMKQRLGIGMSLLSEPEILVLDEPVNGLDPEGIADVRNILRRINNELKVSVLISSHLLSELSELCTDYTIINHGRVIEELTKQELSLRCRRRISLKTTDPDRTAAILEDSLSINNYKVQYGGEIHIFEQLDNVEKISRTLMDNRIAITRLCEEGQSLEDYYLEKTGGEKNV